MKPLRGYLSLVHRLRFGARRVLVYVDPDIDDRALACGNPFARFFQRRSDLSRLAYCDAPTAEAFGKFFEIDVAELVADATALGAILADLSATDLIHRRVIADYGHVRQFEALRGLHVPGRHTEGAIAVITEHFFLGMDELRGHCEGSTDAKRAERTRVHPVAGFARLDGCRRDRHHVATITDIDGVVGEKLVDLVS